uniref:Uncharacterized protein n=1 Tax=Ditylenchus dipsaci TaxID=166011 RepID=A0A915EE96_9BILA
MTFRRICPVLMLLGDVDEVGLRVAQSSKQSFSKVNRAHHRFCRFLSFAVFKILLSVQCLSLFKSMKKDVDVESLIRLHKEFLGRVLVEIKDPIRYLSAIRRTLKVVDHLLASADEKKIPKYAEEICKTLELIENLLNEAEVEKCQIEDVKADIKSK